MSARCKKNFAYFMQYHKKQRTNLKEIYEKRFAAIYHLFDDHCHCTPECPAKKHQANNLPYTPKHPYLNPKMHLDIRDDLISVIDFYTQPARLSEVFHEGIQDRGTQHNEAVNNSTLTMAPKARNYATSYSFNDRTNTMIGIHNFGYVNFYTAVNSLLGTCIPGYLRKYLEKKDEMKLKRRLYQKQPQVKKRRKTSYANKYIKKILYGRRILCQQQWTLYREHYC